MLLQTCMELVQLAFSWTFCFFCLCFKPTSWPELDQPISLLDALVRMIHCWHLGKERAVSSASISDLHYSYSEHPSLRAVGSDTRVHLCRSRTPAWINQNSKSIEKCPSRVQMPNPSKLQSTDLNLTFSRRHTTWMIDMNIHRYMTKNTCFKKSKKQARPSIEELWKVPRNKSIWQGISKGFDPINQIKLQP